MSLLHLGRGLSSLVRQTNINTPPPPASVSLDAPIESALEPKALYAFGFDRLVENYTGHTVRLKRLSDNIEQDFGVDADGFFMLSDVHTWRAGSDVDVVKFYDQKSSLKELSATGQVTFIISDTPHTFGTDWSNTDAQLSRNPNKGGVACDFGLDRGFLSVDGLTVSTSNGFEGHMLWSYNTRKVWSGAVSTDPFGGNSAKEYIFSYGHDHSQTMRLHTGGPSTLFMRIITSGSVWSDRTYSGSYKAFAQNVASFFLTPTNFGAYSRDQKMIDGTLSSANQTNVAAGVLDNGRMAIGNQLIGATGFDNNEHGNMFFGGVILTAALTDLERWALQQKLNAVGQQHRVKSKAEIQSYFEDIVSYKDVNPTSGIVTGINGNATLEFNMLTVAEGTPDWDLQYVQPDIGLTGIYSPTDNAANGFISNDATPPDLNGTVVSVHYSENNGNSVMNCLAVANGSPFDSSMTDLSLSLGFDHAEASTMNMVADSRDDDNVISSRHSADGTITIGDKTGNQAHGKYNRNNAHDDFVDGETFDGHTWDRASWENTNPAQPYLLDGPVMRPLKDNIKSLPKDNVLTVQIATFKAPVGYNKTDPYTTRKPLLLQADNWSYVSQGHILGQRDGDIAHNPYGSVTDHAVGARFMSRQSLQKTMQGTRFLMAYSPNILTDSQIEDVQVNLYKFLI